MKTKLVYRIVIQQKNEIWELYAKEIYQSDLWGFIEIENIIFDKSLYNSIINNIENIFRNVQRSYIPIALILRIDEIIYKYN